MAQFLETVIRINAEMGNGFSKVGATLTELGSIVDGLSQPLIEFGKESVEVYRDYEKSMRDAEVALSTNYGQGTQRLQTVMEQLDAAATEWAASTIFHTDDVSHAISEAAHAGWDYEQIMAGIPAAIKLAQAGSLDLSDAVNYVVKSTNAAGIGFEDMDYWIDLWTDAANSSASDIGEFGDAMLRMGSTMRFAANPEELMTLIAITADMGSVGSEAGTMIRNSLMRLIAPTDKAKGAMEELGATSDEVSEVMNDEALAAANAELAARGFTVFDQETGELRPILDIYSDLSDILAGIAGGYENISSNGEALDLLGAIFPTRSITEALNLINAASDGYGGLYDRLISGEAVGYGQYAADTMMDTLNGNIEIFESKFERLKQVLGEDLKDQVEGLTGVVGEVVDWIAELEPDKFSALTGGAETLALAGPGLLAAGTAFRMIGLVFGTTGGAIAAGALALATGLGALTAWDAEQFDEKFGTMSLDLAELDRNLDSLTTDGEQKIAVVEEYVTRLGELAGEYQTAMGALTQEIAMAALTGKVLTDDERDQLLAYGQSITDTVIEGIQTRRDSSLTFLNAISPDKMSGDEYETYSGLFDMLTAYYGDLVGEAQGIGAQLREAILGALADDGAIDENERETVQKYIDSLNRIQSEIAKQQAQASFYAELEKAGRVGVDDIEEYMQSLQDNQAQRMADVEDRYATEIGGARAAYAADFEQEHDRALTEEEWVTSDKYRFYAGERDKALQEVQSQTAQLAMTAFSALMNDAGLTDSLNAAMQIMAESGGDYSTINWGEYIRSGTLPATFQEDMYTLTRGTWALGLGPSKFAEMLEGFESDPVLGPLYEAFSSGGLFGQSDLEQILGALNTFGEQFGGYENAYQIAMTTDVDSTELDSAIAEAEQGTAMPVQITSYDGSESPITALRDQGVDVSVNGDVSELTATIDGEDGRELLTYVDGDTTDLSMAIWDENGQTLLEWVTGDASQLEAIINRYNGRTVTVNIRGRQLFAEGGRATTASIFGEAGPEWAIPEEHTQRTAELLTAAAAASGFTWPDLLSAAGAMGSVRTETAGPVIYSPVIHAENAAGVETVLREDHARFARWWEEKQMHDSAEVYT